jgi:hypothetical protein
VTLGAKGRDTSAAAALAEGDGAGGDAIGFALAACFFADFFGAALFLRLPALFFLPVERFADALRADFFLPAFLRADFFDCLRFGPFFRAGFLRAARLRADRLRLLFLRAAIFDLPRDAEPRRRVRAILRSRPNNQQASRSEP